MTVATTMVDGTVTVEMSGKMDMGQSHAVRAALLSAVRRSTKIVVDLSDVTMMDAAIIANLVEALGLVQDNGGTFTLRGVNTQVRRILEIFKLDIVFGLKDQEQHRESE